MREYDIYFPTTLNNGSPIPAGDIERLKSKLTEGFGGLTHLKQRSDGIWRFGGATFREEVTIVRLLDDGSAVFDMGKFKEELAAVFRQESVLIVARNVRIV
jgi:hypothetical protein